MQGKRMTLLIGDRDVWRGRPLYLAVLERLRREGFFGATVTRGIAGYGGRGPVRMAGVEVVSEMPVVVTVLDAPERIERIVPEIVAMLGGGVLAVEDVDLRYFAGMFGTGFPDRRVSDVMSAEPEHTTPDAPLAAVVRRLLERDYTALPVVDRERRVVGILDEAELLDRGLTELSLSLHKVVGPALVDEYLRRLTDRGVTVGAAMTPALTVAQDRSLREAAHLMHSRGLKRIPVVDDQERLVGVLARLDILASLASAHGGRPAQGAPGLPARHATVGDVMEREVPAVAEDVGLLEVLERLLESRVKRVVVVDAERRPAGVITDTDLVARVDPEERPGLVTVLRSRFSPEARERLQRARAHRAADLMSRPAIVVRESAPIDEALALTVGRHIKRLPVVDADGRLAGMVSRPALLAAALELGDGARHPPPADRPVSG